MLRHSHSRSRLAQDRVVSPALLQESLIIPRSSRLLKSYLMWMLDLRYQTPIAQLLDINYSHYANQMKSDPTFPLLGSSRVLSATTLLRHCFFVIFFFSAISFECSNRRHNSSLPWDCPCCSVLAVTDRTAIFVFL